MSLSYPNGGHFASCFLCAACICLQKRNGPWAVPVFWLFAEQNEFDLAVRGIRLAEDEQLQRAAREIQFLRDCAVDLLALLVRLALQHRDHHAPAVHTDEDLLLLRDRRGLLRFRRFGACPRTRIRRRRRPWLDRQCAARLRFVRFRFFHLRHVHRLLPLGVEHQRLGAARQIRFRTRRIRLTGAVLFRVPTDQLRPVRRCHVRERRPDQDACAVFGEGFPVCHQHDLSVGICRGRPEHRAVSLVDRLTGEILMATFRIADVALGIPVDQIAVADRVLIRDRRGDDGLAVVTEEIPCAPAKVIVQLFLDRALCVEADEVRISALGPENVDRSVSIDVKAVSGIAPASDRIARIQRAVFFEQAIQIFGIDAVFIRFD